MNKKVFMTWLAATVLASLVGYSQDNAQTGTTDSVVIGGARLGVGAGFRNFHTVRLKGVSQNSFKGIWTTDPQKMQEYNSNSVRNIVSPFPVGEGRPGFYLPTKANITEVTGYSLSGHGDWGTMESMAPVVSLEGELYQNDSWTLGVISNLQYYNMDTASYCSGGADNETTTTTIVAWKEGGPFGPLDDYPHEYETVRNTNYLTGTGRTKFDLQMLEIDLGLKLGYTLASGLDFYVAAGPSLSYADMESSSGGHHDNDLDYIFGIYTAIGSSYWFNESYGISFDVRYDEAFKHADTRYANLNLDSWSAVLKLLIQF